MQKFTLGEIHCSSSADNYRGQRAVVGIWFWECIIWVWKQGQATEITPLISCVRCGGIEGSLNHSYSLISQIKWLVRLKTRSLALHGRQRRGRGSTFVYVGVFFLGGGVWSERDPGEVKRRWWVKRYGRTDGEKFYCAGNESLWSYKSLGCTSPSPSSPRLPARPRSAGTSGFKAAQ